MSDESDAMGQVREEFRRKGADLGALFGSIVTMREGESIEFNGLVYVRDDSGRVGSYRGPLNLRLVDRNGAYTNYRLWSSVIDVGIEGVSDFVMRDLAHPIQPGREHNGPYLYAPRERRPGVVVIESLVEVGSDVKQDA